MRKKLNSGFKTLSCQIAKLGDEKFGDNIVILNVKKLTATADFIILITVYSHPQLEAVLKHIAGKLIEKGVYWLRKESQKNAGWKVLDYGGVLVHIMVEEYRLFYNIERLWTEAKKVDWKNDKTKDKKPCS